MGGCISANSSKLNKKQGGSQYKKSEPGSSQQTQTEESRPGSSQQTEENKYQCEKKTRRQRDVGYQLYMAKRTAEHDYESIDENDIDCSHSTLDQGYLKPKCRILWVEQMDDEMESISMTNSAAGLPRSNDVSKGKKKIRYFETSELVNNFKPVKVHYVQDHDILPFLAPEITQKRQESRDKYDKSSPALRTRCNSRLSEMKQVESNRQQDKLHNLESKQRSLVNEMNEINREIQELRNDIALNENDTKAGIFKKRDPVGNETFKEDTDKAYDVDIDNTEITTNNSK